MASPQVKIRREILEDDKRYSDFKYGFQLGVKTALRLHRQVCKTGLSPAEKLAVKDKDEELRGLVEKIRVKGTRRKLM